MKSGIYLIKNIKNNKVYIGSAVNIDKRWSQHKHYLKEGKHHSEHLQKAWNKYGEQSFTFDIIEEVSNPEHLLAYEQVYLDYYKSYEDDRGYNICKVAGSPLGVKHSEETRKKMSEASRNISEETRKKRSVALTGRKHTEQSKRKISEAKRNISEETRKKISEAAKDRMSSKEARKKISEALTGRKLSQETKKKISQANIGKKLSEEHKKKLSEVNKNMSEETKQKLRKANIGKKLSEEHKKKLSEAKKRKKHSEVQTSVVK